MKYILTIPFCLLLFLAHAQYDVIDANNSNGGQIKLANNELETGAFSVSSKGKLTFAIDANNNDGNSEFVIGKDGYDPLATTWSQLFRLNNSGQAYITSTNNQALTIKRDVVDAGGTVVFSNADGIKAGINFSGDNSLNLQVTSDLTTALTIDQDANVGIGTSLPKNRFHVFDENFGTKSDYAVALIESKEAHLDLLSSSDGTWGSSLNLVEGNGTENVDIWSITRQTSNGVGNSSLNFNFGTENNPLQNSTLFTMNSSGNVGIGTTDPLDLLHVFTNSESLEWPIVVHNRINKEDVTGYGVGIKLKHAAKDENKWSGIASIQESSWANKSGLALYANETEYMRINSSGNVGIGTVDPQNELSVNGTIWAKEIKVKLEDGADWVFEDDYELRSLEEVENFISENRHLPDIPSAEAFRANDLNVAEMNNKLLQKIEELTLYMIDMNKRMQQVEEENTALKEEITLLKND